MHIDPAERWNHGILGCFAQLWVEDSSLAGNRAADIGGAVSCGPAAHCGLRGASLSGNAAKTDGGGAHLIGCAQGFASSSKFTANGAVQNGGALYALSTPLSIESSSFLANVANIGGGAIAVDGCALTTRHTAFTGNRAVGLFPKGGAVLAVGGTAWEAEACVFSGNRAAQAASGFQSDAAGVGDDADDRAAVAAAAAAAAVADAAALGSGVSGKARGQYVDTFGADSGGAVLAEGDAETPTSIALARCTFARGLARQGGALATFGAVAVTSNASIFLANEARFGGVFYLGAGDITVALSEQCSFEEKRAYVGAVVMANSTSLPALPDGTLPAGLPGSNNASNYGPVFATLPAAWAATSARTARTKGLLAVSVTLFDLFNQTVLFWDDAAVALSRRAPTLGCSTEPSACVTALLLSSRQGPLIGSSSRTDGEDAPCPAFSCRPFRSEDPALLSGTLKAQYADGAASFPSLFVHGVPDREYPFTVAISSPTVAAQIPSFAVRTVAIERCRFAERFNEASRSCDCTDQSLYSEETGGCVCTYGFMMATDGVCLEVSSRVSSSPSRSACLRE